MDRKVVGALLGASPYYVLYSKLASAAVMARDKGTPGQRGPSIRAVPVTLDTRAKPTTQDSSVKGEPARSKGAHLKSKIQAKRSARDKRCEVSLPASTV